MQKRIKISLDLLTPKMYIVNGFMMCSNTVCKKKNSGHYFELYLSNGFIPSNS